MNDNTNVPSITLALPAGITMKDVVRARKQMAYRKARALKLKLAMEYLKQQGGVA